jgi:VanZ family protein
MTASMQDSAHGVGRRELRLGRLWWLAGWVLLLGVVFGCLEPARYVPNLHVSDKFEHAGAYFLVTFWFGGLLEYRGYPLLAAALLALGVLIEVAQGFMGAGRSADAWDFVADAVGVFAGLAFMYAGLGSWMIQLERRFGLYRERP